MVMIDGVKVNDTMWRSASKDYLGIVDLSQAVERAGEPHQKIAERISVIEQRAALPFLDQNGNGKQDAKEPAIFQLLNVGTAKITGYEGSVRYSPVILMNVTGNITKTTGTDTLANVPLDRIPPVFENLTLTIFGSSAKRLWGELLVRGGATVAERVRTVLGIDNLTDEAYKSHDSWVYRPGRQLVIGTEYRF